MSWRQFRDQDVPAGKAARPAASHAPRREAAQAPPLRASVLSDPSGGFHVLTILSRPATELVSPARRLNELAAQFRR